MKKTTSNQTPEVLKGIAPEGTNLFSTLLRIGFFSIAYFAAQILAFQFPESFGLVVSIWPAAGVALAALLLSPRRLWPSLLGCLFAAGLAANLTTPRPFIASLGFMSANICETAASAWLITRLCGDRVRFVRIREVMALATAVIFVNAVTSLIGAATASLAFGSRFSTFYETWWIADGLGLLLVTPLAVALEDLQRTRKAVQWGLTVETACLFALGCAATWFSFGSETMEGAIDVKPYLLPVFIIWAAFRIGPSGTATLMATFAVIAIGCTAAGIGSFPLGGADASLHLFAVQVFLGVTGLTGLLLAAAVAQQRESHALLNAVVEGTTDAVFVKDLQGRYLLFNSVAARFVGKTAPEVIGKDDATLFPLQEAKAVMQKDQAILSAAVIKSYEESVTGVAGEPLTFLETKGPIYDETGGVVGLFGIARDITERKKADVYRDMSLKVMQILNGLDGLREAIGHVLAFMKTQTGADAIGLRLQDGEDFPYFAQVGFSADFLFTENTLAERGPDGGVCRDRAGNVCLECTCGLVISGKTDPSHPLFTRGGSFWTNDSALLLDMPSDQDPRHHPRNECIHQGYASVALIPIRDKERIVGLLHLNARSKGIFSLTTVEILEDLATHIGEALTRKQVEETLRETEAILQAAMDQSPAGIAIADAPSGKLRYVNDSGLLIRGGTRETVINGIDIDQYVASWRLMDLDGRPLKPDEVPLARAILFGETCSREFIIRKNDGDDRIVIGNAAPIKDDDGRVVAGVVVFTDITGYKRIEAVQTFLAQTGIGGKSEPFFNALARYLAQSLNMDFVCIDRLEGDHLNARTVAVWCDGHFEDNVTYALKDTPCGDVVGKEICCFPASVCQYFPRDQVLKDLRAECYVGVTLFGHTGKPVGLIAVIGRIPLANRPLAEAVLKLVAVRAASEIERQDAELELQKLDKLRSIGTLAGGIAHDFNNILLGIFGNLSIAMDDLSKEHPSYEPLKEAEKSMTRAVRLTKQLLTFAKGGAPVKEHVSLEAMAEEVARFDLTGSNVSLVYHHDADLWPVDADRGQIQQIISNLVINASQAMPKGGKLTITLENADLSAEAVPALKPGRYVKVMIQDEGGGIEPKVIDRIFDPYFTTKQAGHGLGLATVWSIINKHGGYIGVESELNKGTSFTFYLPASTSLLSTEAKRPAAECPAPVRPAKILVMDDEDSVSRLVVRMLTPTGYTVATAPDGQETLALYKQALEAGASFDAVIMDLTIPGGPGGEEIIQDLLALDPNVRAIVSSGYADDPVMANPGAYGFKGTVAKPYTSTALREAVARVLV